MAEMRIRTEAEYAERIYTVEIESRREHEDIEISSMDGSITEVYSGAEDELRHITDRANHAIRVAMGIA